MTTDVWQPDRSLAFADHRLRPALDLLARVPMEAPARGVDLGHGTSTLGPFWTRTAPRSGPPIAPCRTAARRSPSAACS